MTTFTLKDIQRHVGVKDDGALGPVTIAAIAHGLGMTPTKHEMRNPDAFFSYIRRNFGALTQVQVNTINGLLAAASHWPTGYLAYALSTGWGECKLEPIDEIGKGRGKKYGVAGARSNGTIGNKYGGQIPYGRGLVQLTWCDNYEWADRICAQLGLIKAGEILANFDLVKRPDIATAILVVGMETGAFTGKKLSDYLPAYGPATVGQFTPARRIINKLDKAAMFANNALTFQIAIGQGVWG